MKRVSLSNILLGVAFGVIALSIGCPAQAQYFTTYATADGWHTNLLLTNPTDAAIALPRPCEMTTCARPQVDAHSYQVRPIEADGLSYTQLDLSSQIAAGLEVRVEITSPIGATLDVPEQVPTSSATIYALYDTPPYNSGLVIVAIDDTLINIADGPSFVLRAGEGRIVAAPSTVVQISNAYSGAGGSVPQGRFLVFGYVNNVHGTLQFRKAY